MVVRDRDFKSHGTREVVVVNLKLAAVRREPRSTETDERLLKIFFEEDDDDNLKSKNTVLACGINASTLDNPARAPNP